VYQATDNLNDIRVTHEKATMLIGRLMLAKMHGGGDGASE
jgi:hypothetical protein